MNIKNVSECRHAATGRCSGCTGGAERASRLPLTLSVWSASYASKRVREIKGIGFELQGLGFQVDGMSLSV